MCHFISQCFNSCIIGSTTLLAIQRNVPAKWHGIYTISQNSFILLHVIMSFMIASLGPFSCIFINFFLRSCILIKESNELQHFRKLQAALSDIQGLDQTELTESSAANKTYQTMKCKVSRESFSA